MYSSEPCCFTQECFEMHSCLFMRLYAIYLTAVEHCIVRIHHTELCFPLLTDICVCVTFCNHEKEWRERSSCCTRARVSLTDKPRSGGVGSSRVRMVSLGDDNRVWSGCTRIVTGEHEIACGSTTLGVVRVLKIFVYFVAMKLYLTVCF